MHFSPVQIAHGYDSLEASRLHRLISACELEQRVELETVRTAARCPTIQHVAYFKHKQQKVAESSRREDCAARFRSPSRLTSCARSGNLSIASRLHSLVKARNRRYLEERSTRPRSDGNHQIPPTMDFFGRRRHVERSGTRSTPARQRHR